MLEQDHEWMDARQIDEKYSPENAQKIMRMAERQDHDTLGVIWRVPKLAERHHKIHEDEEHQGAALPGA